MPRFRFSLRAWDLIIFLLTLTQILETMHLFIWKLPLGFFLFLTKPWDSQRFELNTFNIVNYIYICLQHVPRSSPLKWSNKSKTKSSKANLIMYTILIDSSEFICIKPEQIFHWRKYSFFTKRARQRTTKLKIKVSAKRRKRTQLISWNCIPEPRPVSTCNY